MVRQNTHITCCRGKINLGTIRQLYVGSRERTLPYWRKLIDEGLRDLVLDSHFSKGHRRSHDGIRCC